MVSGSRKEALVAELTAHAHKFLSGLSEREGGHDEAPSPHDFIEAALAACTILTGQLYANRKGYKLESTDVVVKILEEGKQTKISRQISYRGDLAPAEKDRLSQILQRCPIHLLLESDVHIETTVV